MAEPSGDGDTAAVSSTGSHRGPAGGQGPGQRHPERPAQHQGECQPPRNVGLGVTGGRSSAVISCFLSERSLMSRFFPLFQSKSSLDPMESQSADAEPPPPPKPELRYPGLSRADTEGEASTRLTRPNATDHQLSHSSLSLSRHPESSLLTEAPPTPSMYKYRPAYSSPGRNHTALTHPNKVRRVQTVDIKHRRVCRTETILRTVGLVLY